VHVLEENAYVSGLVHNPTKVVLLVTWAMSNMLDLEFGGFHKGFLPICSMFHVPLISYMPPKVTEVGLQTYFSWL